jgi:hypothetical protein
VKIVDLVNPIFKIGGVINIIINLHSTLGETIWTVVRAGNMDKGEMEGENGDDPAVNSSIGGDIWVFEHFFNIASINFNNKIADANKIKAKSTE